RLGRRAAREPETTRQLPVHSQPKPRSVTAPYSMASLPARRLGELFGRTPLTVKLLVAVLGLTTGAVTLMGVVTVTALQEELTSRVDDRLADLATQARRQISAGHSNLVFKVPKDRDQGVQLPNPYIIESLAANGDIVDSGPNPLPSDAPRLTGADLSRVGPFTV